MMAYKDKIDHFVYWFFGTMFLLQFPIDTGLVFIVAIILAVAKEVHDGARNTAEEHFFDASAGTLGAIVAIVMESV